MSAVDLALATLRALLDAGVREFVLCPGSRNTPLALALAEADRAGRLRLHVRIDERTAAFLALGLAKGSGRPAAVCSTSGTAVANFHPAVVEAAMSRTPLAVLTANRPLSMLGTGANQTIPQLGIYGELARSAVHLDDQNPHEWSGTLHAACAALTGSPAGPGPVQLDLGLTPPLVPSDMADLALGEPADLGLGEPAVDGSSVPGRAPDVDVTRLDLPPRTLVVVAECEPELARSAVSSAVAAGYPVHVEAGTALAAAGDGTLRAGTFLLRSALVDRHRPEHLLVVGRPTLSRHVPALIAREDIAVTVVDNDPGLTNALQSGSPARPAIRLQVDGTVDAAYAAAWRSADHAAAAVLDAQTAEVFDAGSAAAVVASTNPDLLVVASSNVIRDLDERAVRRRQPVVTNRGAAGIDGLVSTAIGAALADQHPARTGDEHSTTGDEPAATGAPESADRRSAPGRRRAVALLGDLAFLHDSTALMLGPDEPRPDLTIVVVNNDGGAIFASLEQGAPAYAEHFERVFGTPHGVRIRDLCAATSTAYQQCDSVESLRAALDGRSCAEHGRCEEHRESCAGRGIRVIEVPVSRVRERERRRELTTRVLAAVDASLDAAAPA